MDVDSEAWIRIIVSTLGPALLFLGTWLTIRQGRRQQSEANTLTRWDSYTGRLEDRLDAIDGRYDTLQSKFDEVYGKWEGERKLRIGYQEFTQRVINHFRKSPQCEDEIGELAQALKDEMNL